MNYSKLKTIALILGLLFISSFAHLHDYKCKHDDLDHPEHVFGDIPEENFPVPQDENGRFLAQTTYNNLRTYGYYDLIPTGSFKTYMQSRLGPALLDYFAGALKVKYPVSGKLTVPTSTKTLCSVTTPSILKTGVTADYFIMFTSEYDKPASSQSTTWVAESYSCYLATGSKRPLVAKTHLNSAVFVDPGNDILLHEKNVYMMLHELTHTLGFASSLYSYYLDANGKKLTGHVLSATSNGATAKVINVESLTTRLRNFFGCSTLKGAYMENSGSSATAGSHFERRMFGFEAMTSGLIYQQAYSQFSLGMLEATGWYVPDYSYADPYWMGQGQGCGFLTDKCSTANTKYDDFCSGSSRGCTVTGRGGGSCSDDTRSDGCKFVHPKVNYDCDNEDASSGARLPSLQAFGRTAYSKCFEGTLSSSSGAAQTSFCFKYACSGSGTATKLAVTVGTKSVACTQAGAVSVSGYKGTITCPDPLTFCSTVGAKVCPRGCMGRGSCVDGKCVCNKGYSGKDCAA